MCWTSVMGMVSSLSGLVGSRQGGLTFPVCLFGRQEFECVDGPPSVGGSTHTRSVICECRRLAACTHSKITSGATPISLPMLLSEVS